MKINEEYSIEAIDFNNVVLNQHYTDKKGNPAIKPVGYFLNLEKALLYMVHHSLNGTGLGEVTEVAKKLLTLRELILLLDSEGMQTLLNENKELKRQIAELKGKGAKR